MHCHGYIKVSDQRFDREGSNSTYNIYHVSLKINNYLSHIGIVGPQCFSTLYLMAF